MVYVSMGEHTQNVGFVWPVWQSGAGSVFRPTGTAPGPGGSGDLHAGSGGLVDVVAASGRPGDSGRGGAAGSARVSGRLAAAREAGDRATRVEQYRGAEPCSEALTAGGGGGGLRRDLYAVDPSAGGQCLAGEVIPDGRFLNAFAAYGAVV